MTRKREQRAARLAVKAVPRASRDEVAGWLGERLKVRIAAPPQGGRANAALEAFLADALGVPRRSVRVMSGHGAASKTLEIEDLEQGELERRVHGLVRQRARRLASHRQFLETRDISLKKARGDSVCN